MVRVAAPPKTTGVGPWAEQAACAGSDADFVDVSGDLAEYLARRYCHRCEVIGDCSTFAESAVPAVHGLWAARLHRGDGTSTSPLDRREADR